MRLESVALALLLALGFWTSCTHRGAAPTKPTGEAGTAQLRLFDPGVLGRPADKPGKLLKAATKGSVDPIYVLTDVKRGKYSSATVVYPRFVTFEQARDCINAVYGESAYKESATLWRIEKPKFWIALDNDKRGVRIMYFAVQPTTDMLGNTTTGRAP